MMTKKSIGEIEVSFAFARHVGPRLIHGAVTLLFDGSRRYSFKSDALWPRTDNYEDVVRIAIEEALQQVQGHLDSPAVILKSIQWDEVSSCKSGFERAARSAILAAFEV